MDVVEETKKLERLHDALSKAAPISGVNFTKKRIDFERSATPQQKADAIALLDSFVDPGPPYREKRAERYSNDLVDGPEKGNPIVAIGDTLDDFIQAFVSKHPEFANPATPEGRSDFGKKLAKIAKIKADLPKPGRP